MTPSEELKALRLNLRALGNDLSELLDQQVALAGQIADLTKGMASVNRQIIELEKKQ
jgi:septal ring factor EnvC (AmiA/AmiB activator)